MMRLLARDVRTAAIGGLLLAIAASGPASAAVCANAAESEALEARILQTELVVAALSCGEKQRYKEFVGRFEKELTKRATVMKKYFARSHGGQANKQLNSFVTEMANEASQRSLAEAGSFCSSASELFEAVLKLEPDDFVSFAVSRPSAGSHGKPVCGQPKAKSEAAAKPNAEAGGDDATRTAARKPEPAAKGSGS